MMVSTKTYQLRMAHRPKEHLASGSFLPLVPETGCRASGLPSHVCAGPPPQPVRGLPQGGLCVVEVGPGCPSRHHTPQGGTPCGGVGAALLPARRHLPGPPRPALLPLALHLLAPPGAQQNPLQPWGSDSQTHFFFHFQTYPGGCVDCTSFALPTHTATRIREVLTPGTYEPGPARCDRAQGRPAGGPESSTATAFVGRTPGGPAAKAERSGHCQPSTAGCRPPRRPGGGQRPSLESPSGQHCAHLGLRSCEIRYFCCFKPLVRGS